MFVKNWSLIIAEKFPIKLRIRASDCANQTFVATNYQSNNYCTINQIRFTDQIFLIFADQSLLSPIDETKLKLTYFQESLFEFTMIKGAPINTVIYNFKRPAGIFLKYFLL